MSSTSGNQRLHAWVDDEWAGILDPDAIHWCDGTAEEYDRCAANSSPPARSRSSTTADAGR